MTTTNPRCAQDLITKGMCVRIQSTNEMGIIDEFTPFGYGFVTSDKSSWTARIVQHDDVTILDNPDDIRTATDAALAYFAQEGESLCRRQRMRYPNDLKPFWRDRLQSHIIYCMQWYYRLQNIQ